MIGGQCERLGVGKIRITARDELLEYDTRTVVGSERVWGFSAPSYYTMTAVGWQIRCSTRDAPQGKSNRDFSIGKM